VRGVRAFAVQDIGNVGVGKKEKEEKKDTPKPVTGLGEALFGAPSFGTASGSANPFSTSTSANPFSSSTSTSTNPFAPKSGNAPANPFASSSTGKPSSQPPSSPDKELPQTFAAALSLNNTPSGNPDTGKPQPHEPWPAESARPVPYPVLWIAEAEYESYDPAPAKSEAAAAQSRWLPKLDQHEGRTEGDDDTGGHDGAFLRFVERVGQNPEQVIRYEFGGRPLLYSKADAVGRALQPAAVGPSDATGMARCGGCGAQRVFEVQLMPRAILELEEEDDGMDGMDWGTIIVGTCDRDCLPPGTAEGEPGYLEEWVGVQWEQLGNS